MNLSSKIGILGGGQLSQMLLDAGRSIKLKDLSFFAENSKNCPAFDRGYPGTEGKINDKGALRAYLSGLDRALFENEFIDCDLLEEASKDLKVRFIPDLSVIRLIQDKLGQKILLDELNIPNSPYHVLAGTEWDEQIESFSAENDSDGFVAKWSRQGYDGKGVFFGAGAAGEGLEDFYKRGKDKGAEIYIEKKLNFASELAMIYCRGGDGKFINYPLVMSEQKQGICFVVKGPATEWGVAPSLEVKAALWGKQIGEKLKLQGTYAVEFFLLKNGELMVNEIAPRVHNSGHYSQDAMDVSQFENHLKSCCGLDLVTPKQKSRAFSMINLIGYKEQSSESSPNTWPEEWKPHWYSKEETRPGRKMGHINSLAESAKEIDQLIEENLDFAAQWQEKESEEQSPKKQSED